jgi:hypothetical protein
MAISKHKMLFLPFDDFNRKFLVIDLFPVNGLIKREVKNNHHLAAL